MQNIFTKLALKLGCDTEATGIEASHERKQVFIFKSNHACSLDIERCVSVHIGNQFRCENTFLSDHYKRCDRLKPWKPTSTLK